MKKLSKANVNRFNSVEAFKGCSASCSCSCRKWYSKGINKKSTRETNSAFAQLR